MGRRIMESASYSLLSINWALPPSIPLHPYAHGGCFRAQVEMQLWVLSTFFNPSLQGRQS